MQQADVRYFLIWKSHDIVLHLWLCSGNNSTYDLGSGNKSPPYYVCVYLKSHQSPTAIRFDVGHAFKDYLRLARIALLDLLRVQHVNL